MSFSNILEKQVKIEMSQESVASSLLPLFCIGTTLAIAGKYALFEAEVNEEFEIRCDDMSSNVQKIGRNNVVPNSFIVCF